MKKVAFLTDERIKMGEKMWIRWFFSSPPEYPHVREAPAGTFIFPIMPRPKPEDRVISGIASSFPRASRKYKILFTPGW